MPATAIALWLLTGGLCFVLGAFLLWRIERSGVRRWGACGRLFGMGERDVAPHAEPGDGDGGRGGRAGRLRGARVVAASLNP